MCWPLTVKAPPSHNVTVTVTDVDEAATITSVPGSFVVGYEENATLDVAVFTATDPRAGHHQVDAGRRRRRRL